MKTARGRNLFFSTSIDEEIEKADVIFVCVDTPTKVSQSVRANICIVYTMNPRQGCESLTKCESCGLLLESNLDEPYLHKTLCEFRNAFGSTFIHSFTTSQFNLTYTI